MTNNMDQNPIFSDNNVETSSPNFFHRFANGLVRYWWAVPGGIVLQTALFLLAIFRWPASWFEDVTSIGLLILALLELVKFVILLVQRKLGKLVASVVLDAVLIVLAGPMLSLIVMSAPDGFARHHKIPEGIVCNEPIKDPSLFGIPNEKATETPIIDSTDKNSYLQITGELGQYWYDFHYAALPAGTVFLKCYEVGKNEPLSMDRLPQKSSFVHPATSSFSKIVDKKDFTLYEGDWGEYYAVRVEVWHREKATGKERKLLEKIYRMEGWQR